MKKYFFLLFIFIFLSGCFTHIEGPSNFTPIELPDNLNHGQTCIGRVVFLLPMLSLIEFREDDDFSVMAAAINGNIQRIIYTETEERLLLLFFYRKCIRAWGTGGYLEKIEASQPKNESEKTAADQPKDAPT